MATSSLFTASLWGASPNNQKKDKYLAIFRINDRQNHFESIDITIRNILSHVHNSVRLIYLNLYSYLDDVHLSAGRRVAVPGREARVGAALHQHQLPLLVRRVLVRGKSLSSSVTSAVTTTMSLTFVCKVNCYFSRYITSKFCLISQPCNQPFVAMSECKFTMLQRMIDAFCKAFTILSILLLRLIRIWNDNIIWNMNHFSVQCQLWPGPQAAQCDLPQRQRGIVSKDTMPRRKGEQCFRYKH